MGGRSHTESDLDLIGKKQNPFQAYKILWLVVKLEKRQEFSTRAPGLFLDSKIHSTNIVLNLLPGDAELLGKGGKV